MIHWGFLVGGCAFCYAIGWLHGASHAYREARIELQSIIDGREARRDAR